MISTLLLLFFLVKKLQRVLSHNLLSFAMRKSVVDALFYCVIMVSCFDLYENWI